MTLAKPALLRLYLCARHVIPLVAKPLLKKRLARGKEHPTRWTEKLGRASAARPDGPLIWLHAVGLGEVLSLRSLVLAMSDLDPTANFLITSTALSSASGIASQMPPRTQHQFLPLDSPTYFAAFLDHWKPDLVIWAEQDIWPGLIHDIHQRAIPQALINARMNKASYGRHVKAQSLYASAFQRMALISAQDHETAIHLKKLGASAPITLNNALKSAAPPLDCDPCDLKTLQRATKNRRVWICAPAHAPEIALAIDAHKSLHAQDPTALLIIAPRNLDTPLPENLPRRSAGQHPDGPIWIADTLGEMGLFYRLADTALIGGTFNDTQGHSPWEAASLGCAILHGPNTANFAEAYGALDRNRAALLVATSTDISDALLHANRGALTKNANDLAAQSRTEIIVLAKSLLQLKALP
ncbi:3-deoxy-D-manno-octulosonic acid transferase [Yoonia sp. MH D7]